MARTEPSPRFEPLALILRKKRAEAGLSQAQVASALGWRQSVVGDAELARFIEKSIAAFASVRNGWTPDS